MSIASRISAQRRAGGRSVRQISRGGTSYTTGSGRSITPTVAEVAKVHAEEVSQETFVDPGRTPNRMGGIVQAKEYIQHHGASFGTDEDASLAAGLTNLFGDSYEVVSPKEGITVVVDGEKDQTTVISDVALTDAEKEGYRGVVDKAGDVPNTTIFVEGGGAYSEAPISETLQEGPSVGGSGAAMGKGTLLLLAGAAVVALLIFGGKR